MSSTQRFIPVVTHVKRIFDSRPCDQSISNILIILGGVAAFVILLQLLLCIFLLQQRKKERNARMMEPRGFVYPVNQESKCATGIGGVAKSNNSNTTLSQLSSQSLGPSLPSLSPLNSLYYTGRGGESASSPRPLSPTQRTEVSLSSTLIVETESTSPSPEPPHPPPRPRLVRLSF